MKNMHQLLTSARQAMANAYAPYSGFKVGAAILADDGKIYTGANVENVSYPCGTCAEAGAIAAMVCGGGKKIAVILVVSGGKVLVTPCGACLQRINEFGGAETPVLLANDEAGVVKEMTLADLLPQAFKEFDR